MALERLEAVATAHIPDLDRLVGRCRREPGRVVGEGRREPGRVVGEGH